jgi:glycosyltransferase involved in cell wall biosynthesis
LPDLPSYLAKEVASFDVVHLNGYRSFMMMTTARAARRAGVAVVMQPHGSLPVMTNSLWLKRIYDRYIGGTELDGISALIALQDTERRQGVARGVSRDRIEIIPNGIDPGERNAAPKKGRFRRRFGLSSERPLILFLARINKTKGTDMLIDAFARMKYRSAQLAIVGPDDGQLFEVRELIRQHALSDRVVLTGLLCGPDVLGALRDADLFVLPSRADAFPFAIVEACLMGTPIVMTDRCEIAGTVRDRVAEVVPFDPFAFADAMDRLLSDDQRREQLRANTALFLQEQFSIRAVADRLESVYLRAVSHGQGSASSPFTD